MVSIKSRHRQKIGKGIKHFFVNLYFYSNNAFILDVTLNLSFFFNEIYKILTVGIMLIKLSYVLKTNYVTLFKHYCIMNIS